MTHLEHNTSRNVRQITAETVTAWAESRLDAMIANLVNGEATFPETWLSEVPGLLELAPSYSLASNIAACLEARMEFDRLNA